MSELIGGGLILVGIAVLMLIGSRMRRVETASATAAMPPPLPATASDQEIFDQLDRFAAAERAEEQRRRKTRIWLRPVGFITRLATYGALFLLLYINRPADISERLLGSLTLSEIIVTACFVGAGILLLRALFNPVQDEGAKDLWGWLGVWLAAALGCAVLYFRTH